MALADDGRIVAAGNTQQTSEGGFATARYKANGAHDNAFSDDGKRLLNFAPGVNEGSNAVAVQPDGKIVQGGFSPSGDFALERLLGG